MFLVRLSSLFLPVLSCNLTYILHQIEMTSRTRLFSEVNKIESINSSKVFTDTTHIYSRNVFQLFQIPMGFARSATHRVCATNLALGSWTGNSVFILGIVPSNLGIF